VFVGGFDSIKIPFAQMSVLLIHLRWNQNVFPVINIISAL
jgi:hypothetical protein